MCRPILAALLAILLAALAVGCSGAPSDRIEVRIGRLVVQAELARTAEERAQGLSGRDSLPEDAGMLFVFPDDMQSAFWMKGMRFPLDFIWISRDLRVVAVTENVPPPAPGAWDDELPRYISSAPVLYTLEVNAGAIRQSGVRVGDTVTFEPDISEEEAP